MLKKLSALQRVIILICFAAAWVVLYYILKKAGAVSALWDNTATLLGILCTVLTMLAFVEYTYLSLVSGVVSIILYIDVISKSPEQTTYLVYSVYSLVCLTVQFINARKFYKQQQKEAAVE